MLYKKNSEHKLSRELFENPTSEYRGAPFWAWNCRLDKRTLDEQIDIFKEMGLGGFHMHVRTGMDTPYLSDEFMGYIKQCVNKAKADGMLAWLYDEDRWPSGAAGGIVTKNKEYACKNILFTPFPYGSEGCFGERGDDNVDGGRTEEGKLLAVYDVVLNSDGTLKDYRRIGEGEKAAGTKWYAYAEIISPSGWFNGERYLDTLSKEAVGEFINVTHRRYYEEVGEEFGKTVPAIFTDEPQFTKKGSLGFADELTDIFMPWTTGMDKMFSELYGMDMLDKLPEVFWDLPNGVASKMRYLYHDFVTELFTSAFCDQIGQWCNEHGIMLSGHVMHEPTLEKQTDMVGEAMRCYRGFADMPGIDMLCDAHEYTTAKQCQSAKHQQGSEAMLSELYGVTGWDYDFRGHKLQGDWQAALGVTVRVQHLTWMSMKGEAKRDYPACIGYQSPWYKKYSLVEDHFARLNTALTRGKPVVKVGVIHPIESFWLHWGPYEQTDTVRNQMENNFQTVITSLLFGLVDFDYISESRLPQLCSKGGVPLKVGAMEYDAIVVPACETLRKTTVERLAEFKAAGGKLIFMGDKPKYMDAEVSDEPAKLFEDSICVSFSGSALLDALEEQRVVDIRFESGARADKLLYQLREDNDCKWLFVANGKNPVSPYIDPGHTAKIVIKGEHAAEVYDTMTGEIYPIPAKYADGKTIITRRWFNHDSLLLKLTAGRNEGSAYVAENPMTEEWRGISPVADIILDEPNAFILDMAEYSADGGEFFAEEEFLRLDNICRERLGIAKRSKYVVQPYLLKREIPKNSITLRMNIPSDIEYEGAKLALEDAEESKIVFNGTEVTAAADGWYVDKAIKTVPLPKINKGDNELIVTVPLAERTNLEYMYILGDFGVQVMGRHKRITAPVKKLWFGSFTNQGLPFYTGNVTYEFTEEVTGGSLELKIERYCGALVDVFVDGELKNSVVYSPYTVKLDGLPDGEHRIGLKLYGTRLNGFGQLHHDTSAFYYQDPNSWRTTDQLWTYEYQLKDFGILKTPEVR